MLIDLENVKAEKSPGEEENGEEVFYNVESTEKMTEYEKEYVFIQNGYHIKFWGPENTPIPPCHPTLSL